MLRFQFNQEPAEHQGRDAESAGGCSSGCSGSGCSGGGVVAEAAEGIKPSHQPVPVGTLFVSLQKNLLWKNAYWGSYSPFWVQQG